MNSKQKAALTYSKETREYIEQMIGGATHEINNLLFIIEGNSELLEISEDKNKRSEFILNIEDQTKRISDVLKGLRSLIKDQDEEVEEISTKLISDQIAEFCKTRFNNHHVFLKTNLPEDVFVEGKKTQIIQAFISVINSSYEAVRNTKGASKWIDLNIEEKSGELKIQIKDSGRIIKGDQDVFDPDYYKNGRKGLPLVVAKDSFEQNGAVLTYLKDQDVNTFEVSFKKFHKANAAEQRVIIPTLKLVG